MALSLVTGPQKEPLTIQELRDHLRVAVDDDDSYLNRLVKVVRLRCERATRRALITQTWDLFLDAWPVLDGIIRLARAPLQSVTFAKYLDMASVTQTWDASNYRIDAPEGDYAARGRLSLGFAKVWPVTLPVANAIQIRQVCGYGDTAADVPELLKQGMLLDAGTLYEIRGSILAGSRAAAIEVPSTSQDIYRSFRSL